MDILLSQDSAPVHLHGCFPPASGRPADRPAAIGFHQPATFASPESRSTDVPAHRSLGPS